MSDKQKREFIIKELSRFNFKKYTKGFKYLIETILLCVKNEDAIENLHKNVFPIIAERYNEKSVSNVKWCIEQIIKTMYNNTPVDVICKYFNLDENIKPSLKLIVYTIVCKYEWEYVNS